MSDCEEEENKMEEQEEQSPETYEGRQSTIKDNRRITCISSAKDLDDVLEVEKLEKVPPETDPPRRPVSTRIEKKEEDNHVVKKRQFSMRRTSLQLQMSDASSMDSFRRNTKFGSILKVRRHCERAISEGTADAKECRESIVQTRVEAARHPTCPMLEVSAGYFQGHVYLYGSILSSISSATAERFWVVLDRLRTPPGLGGVRKRKSSRTDFCPVLRIHSKRTSFPDNTSSNLECVAWLLHSTRIVIVRCQITSTMMITGVHVAETLDGLPLRFPQSISFVFQEDDTEYLLIWKRVLESVLPLKVKDGMSLSPRHRASTISSSLVSTPQMGNGSSGSISVCSRVFTH